MLGPWNAAALPEIMAGTLKEGKRGVLGGGQTGEQQASNQEAPPEQASSAAGARGGGMRTPSQGLTLRLTGVPKARPS